MAVCSKQRSGWTLFNTLKQWQNGRHFTDDIFKSIFLNANFRISNKIPMKFVSRGPINNIPALVEIMVWCRPGNKPLSELMMVRSLTHICITRAQWVNPQLVESFSINIDMFLLVMSSSILMRDWCLKFFLMEDKDLSIFYIWCYLWLWHKGSGHLYSDCATTGLLHESSLQSSPNFSQIETAFQWLLR